MQFTLSAPYQPTGDQPQAIEKLVANVGRGSQHQVLLGVTGSGKTFTMANCIATLNRPALVISHNKTLAAQLYQEFRVFFPNNAVSYFVSYYDYYQPEAYLPQTDTYIEKETEINEQIDKLRLAATTNLLTRPDTIIVASVSCIYNIGSPREYGNFVVDLRRNLKIARGSILSRLVDLQYERADYGFHRGTFRVVGENIDIFLAYEDYAYRVTHDGTHVTTIAKIDPLNGTIIEELERCVVYPAKHYMTNRQKIGEVFETIRQDLNERVAWFKNHNKPLEAHRLNQRVNFDLEMIQEVGFVNGIENYSRYFDGRNPGDPPFTLLEYFKEAYGKDWLLFIDESHMTIPQIRGMYAGDRSRKQVLIDYGFRLPAAIDNRPLKFEEFMRRTPQTIYVSATPAPWELSMAGREETVEQLIRPTGLVDPIISVRPTEGQIGDLIKEILKRKQRGQRVLVTTLTKRMAEDLADFLSNEENIKKPYDSAQRQPTIRQLTDNLQPHELPTVHYLHSDIVTLERTDILDDLRRGKYDVLIGINLLREGLDLPEVSLVAILDADKEGFLRSETSLIQTMGRAARHVAGEVIMYADHMTGSMERAIAEVKRRRDIQLQYNKTHGITPTSIQKQFRDKLVEDKEENQENAKGFKHWDDPLFHDQLAKTDQLLPEDRKKLIKHLTLMMKESASDLHFELAAQIRDKIKTLMANSQ